MVARDGRWVRTATLVGFDPATFHPVIVDYVGAQPWVRYDEYRVKYPKHGHPHGMPPGQAKKMYRQGYQDGRHEDRDEDDDRGHDKYKDKHKGKGHDRD